MHDYGDELQGFATQAFVRNDVSWYAIQLYALGINSGSFR